MIFELKILPCVILKILRYYIYSEGVGSCQTENLYPNRQKVNRFGKDSCPNLQIWPRIGKIPKPMFEQWKVGTLFSKPQINMICSDFGLKKMSIWTFGNVLIFYYLKFIILISLTSDFNNKKILFILRYLSLNICVLYIVKIWKKYK